MKIAIFDDDYPDEHNLPGDMFAHTRVRLYAREAQVLVLRRASASRSLTYEGVEIKNYVDSLEALSIMAKFKPDVAGVHFAGEPFISEISSALNCPLFVWVHGIEALAWHQSLYNLNLLDWLPHRVLFRHRRSNERIANFSKLIHMSNGGAPIHFVFVSKWMLNMCEASTRLDIHYKSIVPNPIDISRFKKVPLSDTGRNLLVIRSSDTMKYRPDMVAKTVRLLMQDKINGYRCRIFSKGALYDRYFLPLAEIPGVEIFRKYLPQDEIVEQHKWGDYFLCPTQQDAQGVSMCEAMASGLIVATTPVTAIPEFASDDTAILAKSASELARRIDLVSNNRERALALSAAAAAHMAATLDASAIVGREMEMMKQYVSTRTA